MSKGKWFLLLIVLLLNIPVINFFMNSGQVSVGFQIYDCVIMSLDSVLFIIFSVVYIYENW